MKVSTFIFLCVLSAAIEIAFVAGVVVLVWKALK